MKRTESWYLLVAAGLAALILSLASRTWHPGRTIPEVTLPPAGSDLTEDGGESSDPSSARESETSVQGRTAAEGTEVTANVPAQSLAGLPIPPPKPKQMPPYGSPEYDSYREACQTYKIQKYSYDLEIATGQDQIRTAYFLIVESLAAIMDSQNAWYPSDERCPLCTEFSDDTDLRYLMVNNRHYHFDKRLFPEYEASLKALNSLDASASNEDVSIALDIDTLDRINARGEEALALLPR